MGQEIKIHSGRSKMSHPAVLETHILKPYASRLRRFEVVCRLSFVVCGDNLKKLGKNSNYEQNIFMLKLNLNFFVWFARLNKIPEV